MAVWKPIDTAPKDGTEILISSDDGMFVGKWSDTKRLWVDSVEGTPFGVSGGWLAAVHWLPLPSPPRDQLDNPNPREHK